MALDDAVARASDLLRRRAESEASADETPRAHPLPPVEQEASPPEPEPETEPEPEPELETLPEPGGEAGFQGGVSEDAPIESKTAAPDTDG